MDEHCPRSCGPCRNLTPPSPPPPLTKEQKKEVAMQLLKEAKINQVKVHIQAEVVNADRAMRVRASNQIPMPKTMTPPTAVCADAHMECPTWARTGDCPQIFVARGCRLSCGSCKPEAGNGDGCVDEWPECAPWAYLGECQKNLAFMTTNCTKSCGFCGKSHSMKDLGAPEIEPFGKPDDTHLEGIYDVPQASKPKQSGTLPTVTAQAATITKQVKPAGSDCVDLLSDCDRLRKDSQCDNNLDYMMMNCQKTCGACRECADIAPECPNWASQGECVRNPRFMVKTCEKSCGLCRFKKEYLEHPTSSSASGNLVGVDGRKANGEEYESPLHKERTQVRCDYAYLDFGVGNGKTTRSFINPDYRWKVSSGGNGTVSSRVRLVAERRQEEFVSTIQRMMKNVDAIQREKWCVFAFEKGEQYSKELSRLKIEAHNAKKVLKMKVYVNEELVSEEEVKSCDPDPKLIYYHSQESSP